MIRPMDLQDNYSKAPLAAREQHILQMRPEMAQHTIARQQNQEHVLDHSRISKSEKADAAENRVDDHESHQQQHQQKSALSQEEKDADNKETPQPRLNGAHFIDITV
ncbi:MAG: hypothetical protein ACI906_005361 [Candidatus Latescibacterota bacterium]|jgi:hypothetical protein